MVIIFCRIKIVQPATQYLFMMFIICWQCVSNREKYCLLLCFMISILPISHLQMLKISRRQYFFFSYLFFKKSLIFSEDNVVGHDGEVWRDPALDGAGVRRRRPWDDGCHLLVPRQVPPVVTLTFINVYAETYFIFKPHVRYPLVDRLPSPSGNFPKI